jgi:hypothetical protein
MSLDNLCGIETNVAVAVRQFYERHEGRDTGSPFGKAYIFSMWPIPSGKTSVLNFA